jgi:hypothetical protein
MNCDFCGGPHATRMEIPYQIHPNLTEEQLARPAIAMSQWGHPLTGNVCRKCLLGQLIKASNKQLVPKQALVDVLHLIDNYAGVELQTSIKLLCNKHGIPNDERPDFAKSLIQDILRGG